MAKYSGCDVPSPSIYDCHITPFPSSRRSRCAYRISSQSKAWSFEPLLLLLLERNRPAIWRACCIFSFRIHVAFNGRPQYNSDCCRKGGSHGPDLDWEYDLHAGIGFSDSQLLGQHEEKYISLSDPGGFDSVHIRRLFSGMDAAEYTDTVGVAELSRDDRTV